MNISPTPWESHFPQSRGGCGAPGHIRSVSALASHFSDHGSACSQMPTPGWPPSSLHIHAQSELSSSSQLLPPPRRPHQLPMAKALSLSIVPNASTSTPSAQLVTEARESRPQCPADPSAPRLCPEWLCFLLTSCSTLVLPRPQIQLPTVTVCWAIRCRASSPSEGNPSTLASLPALPGPATSLRALYVPASLNHSPFSHTLCSHLPLSLCTGCSSCLECSSPPSPTSCLTTAQMPFRTQLRRHGLLKPSLTPKVWFSTPWSPTCVSQATAAGTRNWSRYFMQKGWNTGNWKKITRRAGRAPKQGAELAHMGAAPRPVGMVGHQQAARELVAWRTGHPAALWRQEPPSPDLQTGHQACTLL